MTKNLAQSSTDSEQLIQSCTACTTEPTLPCLIDKFANIAIENNEVALIVATAIAISIVIHAVSKSVAAIITAWRTNK